MESVEIVVIIACSIIIVPLCLVLAGFCVMAFLDIYQDIKRDISRIREKNYCRECGKVIPKGQRYCTKCHMNLYWE